MLSIWTSICKSIGRMRYIRSLLFICLFMASSSALSLQDDVQGLCVKYLDMSPVDSMILGLSENAKIPDAVFEEFQPNEIARAIVKRIRRREISDSPRETREKIDLISDSDIIMFFKAQVFTSIGERGFLNAFQTGKTNGGLDAVDLNVRAAAENAVTGLDLGRGAAQDTVRPKSTFLNIRADVNLAPKWHWMVHQFGGCGAVLKNNVKERAVWLSGDSLNIGMGKEFNGTSPSSLQDVRGTFDSACLPNKSGCPGYYESVVYGSISLDDVDYFLAMPDCVQAAIETGKAVYEMVSERRNDRFIFNKGKCLSAACSNL